MEMDSHNSDAPGFENPEDGRSTSRKDRLSDPGDESISDEEKCVVSKFLFTPGVAESQRNYCPNFDTENHNGTCSWSAILEEADELVSSHKKSYSSSFNSGIPQERKIRRGGRGRAKLKFCIRYKSHKEELNQSCAVNNGNEISLEEETEDPAGLEQITEENSMADLLGNLQEEIDEFPTKLISHEPSYAMPSVAELLEDLQEKNVPFNSSSNLWLRNVKAKDRKTQFSGKRIMSSLGTRILDNEDPPEFMGSGLSSEGKGNDQNNLSFTAKIIGQTMTDLFQEAFTSKVEEPLLPINKQVSTEYHGRLQQVLQVEKDRHLGFLKKLQTGCSPYNESRCIDVRILSRYLEAKLTVCHCLFAENCLFAESIKNFQCEKSLQDCVDDGGTVKRTIIFSSKICDNVELEVGNLVRIHPPWFLDTPSVAKLSGQVSASIVEGLLPVVILVNLPYGLTPSDACRVLERTQVVNFRQLKERSPSE